MSQMGFSRHVCHYAMRMTNTTDCDTVSVWILDNAKEFRVDENVDSPDQPQVAKRNKENINTERPVGAAWPRNQCPSNNLVAIIPSAPPNPQGAANARVREPNGQVERSNGVNLRVPLSEDGANVAKLVEMGFAAEKAYEVLKYAPSLQDAVSELASMPDSIAPVPSINRFNGQSDTIVLVEKLGDSDGVSSTHDNDDEKATTPRAGPLPLERHDNPDLSILSVDGLQPCTGEADHARINDDDGEDCEGDDGEYDSGDIDGEVQGDEKVQHQTDPLPESPHDFMGVSRWLELKQLNHHKDLFHKHQIDMVALKQLTCASLKMIGIEAVGEQLRVMRHILESFPDAAAHIGHKHTRSVSLDLEEDRKNEGTIGDVRAVDDESGLCLAFLHADPLMNTGSILDLEKEKKMLMQSLSESNRKIRARFGVGTCDMFRKLLTLGVEVLHISGHGNKENLVLEDGAGGLSILKTNTLRQALIIGGRALQCVFVATCHSHSAAQAFVDADVPHVIAIHPEALVMDECAQEFASHFYLALCSGRTVQSAFDQALAAVKLVESENGCCCSHLHYDSCPKCPTCKQTYCCNSHRQKCCPASQGCCNESAPHREHEKFSLLPDNVDHNVPIFPNVPVGDWVDVTPPMCTNNLPPNPEMLLGRNRDLHSFLSKYLLHSRFCSVVGLNGVGKTALVKRVANYAMERRHFPDGMFWVRCEGIASMSDMLNSICLTVCGPDRSDSSGSLSPLRLSSPAFGSHAPLENSDVVSQNRVWQTCHNRDMLLILDGCDDLVANALLASDFSRFIKEFFDHCGNVKLLITSRSRIRVDSVRQRTFMLSPMSAADASALFYLR